MKSAMGRDKKRGLPLFYRFLITFLGVITVIGGILTLAYYHFSKTSLESHTQEDIIQRIQAISQQFDYALKEDLVRNLQILNSNPTLDEFMMSSELDREINARKVERLFMQTLNYIINYESITFVDQSGKEKIRVARKGRITQYRDIKDSMFFRSIETGMPGSIHIVGPYKTRDGLITFSIGIHKVDADIGKFGGTVIIDYSLNYFLEQIKAVKILGENLVWVFTPQGEVLDRPANSESVFNPAPYLPHGNQQFPASKIVKEGLLVYQDVSILPDRSLLRIAVSVPSSLLLKDIHAVLRFIFLVFVISLVIVFVISYSLAEYLSRPIIGLSQAAARLAKGDLSTQVNVKTTGEVQMLVDSFNLMARNLEKTTVSKDYVDNIIKSMTDTLIVASPDGAIRTVNQAACALLGYREEELLGQSIKKIWAADRNGDLALDEVIQYGLMKNAEFAYVTKDNRRIPVLFSSSVIYANDAALQGIVCVAVDITERKRTEEKLRRYASDIEQANEELKTFTYTVSHDLRAPLVNIRGFSEEFKRTIQDGREFLAKYVPALSEADKKTYSTIFEHDINEAVGFIGASVSRMDFLIESILKLSRLGRSELKPELIKTEQLVHSLLKTLQHQLKSRLAQVRVDPLPDLLIDRTAIERIFGNLLENAVKYLEPARPGSIEISAKQEQEDTVFTIRDNGRGIAPDDIKKVFDPFRRAGKQDVPGGGMGLSYVKTLVKRLGGRIWCDSELGVGTAFSFTIPAKPIIS